MKALFVALTLVSLDLIGLTASAASADPRPPGGHRIISKPIPAGTCSKRLVYYNKFSSAYTTVCNTNPKLPRFF